MAGIRDRNLRSGYIHEELGVLLIRPVALVAPVPLWEDVGLDAVATLLRPDGGRHLIPEDTFGVQIKASSERVVSYDSQDAARWVVNLALPFFIGSVQLIGAKIDLYATHNLFKVRAHSGLKEVHLHFDDMKGDNFGAPEIARVHIGPPVDSWSAKDISDRDFPARVYPLLKAHIQAAQRNIVGRAVGHFDPVVWEPGPMPMQTGAFIVQSGGGGQEVSAALASLVAPIHALLLALGRPRNVALLPGVFEFIKTMRALGTDADPDDGLMKLALANSLSDDAGKQVLRRLFAQGMTPAGLTVNGQRIDAMGMSSEPTSDTPSRPELSSEGESPKGPAA